MAPNLTLGANGDKDKTIRLVATAGFENTV